MIEALIKSLIPLIVDYTAGNLPAPYKRLLFLNVAALGAEGRALLSKTETGIDDKLLESILDEASQEFGQAEFLGVEEVDAFVSFTV